MSDESKDSEENRDIQTSDLQVLADLRNSFIGFYRITLSHTYSTDISLISDNEEALVSFVGSDDPQLQRLALDSLIFVNFIYNTIINTFCIKYMTVGEYTDIKQRCVMYLSSAFAYNKDQQIIESLRACAESLRLSDVSPDETFMIKFIDYTLELLESVNKRPKRR